MPKAYRGFFRVKLTVRVTSAMPARHGRDVWVIRPGAYTVAGMGVSISQLGLAVAPSLHGRSQVVIMPCPPN